MFCQMSFSIRSSNRWFSLIIHPVLYSYRLLHYILSYRLLHYIILWFIDYINYIWRMDVLVSWLKSFIFLGFIYWFHVWSFGCILLFDLHEISYFCLLFRFGIVESRLHMLRFRIYVWQMQLNELIDGAFAIPSILRSNGIYTVYIVPALVIRCPPVQTSNTWSWLLSSKLRLHRIFV